jgi:DNA-binding Xre family transcriptional regulator
VKWNLRLAAANRGIWKASELQKMLAARGMVISAGKMSGLWSGSPNTIRLGELDVICAVLGCEVGELLLPEPGKVPQPAPDEAGKPAAAAAARAVTPRARDGRSPTAGPAPPPGARWTA